MGIDKRVFSGGLPTDEIRKLLQKHLIMGMRELAGYTPKQTSFESTPYSLARPLVLIRNTPVFSMNTGWWDACVDWLREMEMPCEPRVAIKKRKQKDDTWIEVLIYTNSIAEHVEKLRKYVRIIDYKYERGIP